MLGVTTWELEDWLDERGGSAHPNIDGTWTESELRTARVRLKRRGLVRGQRPSGDPESGNVWRPTAAAGDYLEERRLFRDAA